MSRRVLSRSWVLGSLSLGGCLALWDQPCDDARCAAYYCTTDGNGCATECTQDADCQSPFLCNADPEFEFRVTDGPGQCVSTCDRVSDCTPYACSYIDDRCVAHGYDDLDCVGEAVCTPDGECI